MRRFAPVLFSLSLTGMPVEAEQRREDEEPVELSPVQVTAGRQHEPQFRVPAPVTVIGPQDIDRVSPQVMTEALRGQAGAFFQQTGPGQGIAILRGLKGAEVLHLVDGMRLNNAFFRTAPSQYIALVDPLNLQQIEVLRGPYGALYGSDAMGGVVQVLTPEYRFGGEGWDLKGGQRLHYASADLARTSRTWIAAGTGSLSVTGGVSVAAYGRRKLPEPAQSPTGAAGPSAREQRVAGTDYLARGHDLKILWSPAPAHELMASLQHFTLPQLPRYNEMVEGYGQPIPGQAAPVDGYPVAIVSVYDNERSFHHLRYRRTAPLGLMDQLELHLARQVVNDDRLDRTNANPGRNVFEYNRSTLTGFTAQARTQAGALDWLYGVELYRDAVDSRTRRQALPAGTFTDNGVSTFQSRFPNGSHADSHDAYALAQWAATPDLTLEAGSRYTRTRTRLAGSPESDRLQQADLENRDVSGSLGARLALTPALAWTLNAGRGYRAPTINDLAQTGARSGGRVVVANYSLGPESVLSVDTGLKWLDGGLQGEATVFVSRYRDRITLMQDVFAPGTGECPGNTAPANNTANCSQNRNIAKAEYFGFEGAVSHAFGPSLTVNASATWTYARQEPSAGTYEPGNRVPPLNGRVGLRWAARPDLRVEPVVYYAGAQHRLDAADRADRRIDPDGTAGHAVVDLDVGFTPSPNLALRLGGRNLLDKAYREHGSGIDGSARGLVATAEYRFR